MTYNQDVERNFFEKKIIEKNVTIFSFVFIFFFEIIDIELHLVFFFLFFSFDVDASMTEYLMSDEIYFQIG
jgi:hypothetical protein